MKEKKPQAPVFPGSGEHSDRTFAGIEFKAGTAEDAQFYGCLFRNCDFTGSVFRRCRFADCRFESCNLSLVRLPRTAVSASFRSCKLTGVNWTEAAWPGVKLPGLLKFDDCVLTDSCFLGLSLRGTALTGCLARGTDLRETDLTGADLSRTDFSGALFGKTCLAGADFGGARNYAIRPSENVIKGAKFAMPEAMALLYCMDIKIL